MAPPAVDASGQHRLVDLIVAGGIVVTMDSQRRVIGEGAVAIQAGRIVAVGPRGEVEAAYVGAERIDARKIFAVPGFHGFIRVTESGMPSKHSKRTRIFSSRAVGRFLPM